jgi:hypothetical protein
MNIRDLTDNEPAVGDIVEMELGDVLVETVIDEVLEDGVVIRVNEEMLSLMIEHDRKLNEARRAANTRINESVSEPDTVDSIIRSHAGKIRSLVEGRGMSVADINTIFTEFLNVNAVSYSELHENRGEVVARIVYEWTKSNDVKQLNEDHTEKSLGELQTDLWELFKDVTGSRPRPGVVDWTNQQWNDPEFLKQQIDSLQGGQMNVDEGNYNDSMTDAEWEREYQREKQEKELARKEIEKNHTSQFKTKEEAIEYAKDKLKTFKDSKIGMSVYAMPDGGFDVASTARTAAAQKRNKLMSDAGGKHLGTLGPRFTKHKMAEAGSPAQQAAIAINMKKAGKTPKSVDEGAEPYDYKVGQQADYVPLNGGYPPFRVEITGIDDEYIEFRSVNGQPIPGTRETEWAADPGWRVLTPVQGMNEQGMAEGKTGPGLWANIHAKRKRIEKGSGERMRKPGSEGAPKTSDFKAAQSKNESSNYGDLDERSIGDAVTKAKDDRAERLRKEWEYRMYVKPLSDDPIDNLDEAKYQGREVTLNSPMAGDVAKSKVYVKNAKGNVVKVNFGQKGVKIKKSNPKRRKSFRARHGCDNPGPKWKAKYWSCRAW